MQAPARQYSFSQFGASRQAYKPSVPITLSTLMCKTKQSTIPIGDDIKKLFPVLTSSPMPLLQFLLSDNQVVQFPPNPVKIGVILSGGQAPGGHNVIAGIYDFAKRINPNSIVYGYKMGPHGLMNNNYIEIKPEYMDLFRNQGGFDMICSGRDKIKTPAQFASSLENATSLDLDGLVVIGGDDSNTNACLLAQYFKEHSSKCRVVGAPKTIDGDLMNQYIPVSFGFHTATRIYSQFIGNLCLDALSSKKYYQQVDYYHLINFSFIRLMGRSASHIALECALLTRPNHVIIGQEVAQKKLTLKQITDNIADIICLRASHGKEYGVILVPEGLIQFIPEINPLIEKISQLFRTKPQFSDQAVAKITTSQLRLKVAQALPKELGSIFTSLPISIADQLLLGRDSHGNLPVSKIDTEKLLILMVQSQLAQRKVNGTFNSSFTAQAHFFGYEGRCGLPSPFDSDYCYSIGETATALISLGYTGYMATIRNIDKSNNPSEWIASGSPLPIMIHMQNRQGKSTPVIKKALVELDGAPFRALKQIRETWAEFDCYQPPGPIQFEGVPLDIPFVIRPLPIDKLKAEAKEIANAQMKFQEKQGHKRKGGKKQTFYAMKHIHHLGVVGKIRMNQVTPIPRYLEDDDFCLHPVKQQNITTRDDEFGILAQQDLKEIARNPLANTYVSVSTKAQGKQLRRQIKSDSPQLDKLIENFLQMEKCRAQNKFKIGVLFNGRQSPGGNNIIDGLLRFASCGMRSKGAVEILGFLNGTKGFFNGQFHLVTQENFQLYRNQGGYDSLGRSADQIRTPQQLRKAAHVCQSLQLDGLVLIGATHTMSDGLYLSNYFLQENLKTNVVVIPCSIDGNVHHNQIQTSIGFDTASKGCAELIGNIMTDAASAIKYWYFIRLMGRDPSHLVLESALKTHPNCVLISEEAAARGQTIQNIVDQIADLICKRAAQNKNFGTIIIPEGLLFHLPHFRHLIAELDDIFIQHSKNDSVTDNIKFKEAMYQNPRKLDEMLSPWSAMVFKMLPQFIQKQLLMERQVNGGVQLSQIETQRLLAFLVEQELKRRKYKQKYGFAFSTVTHFFGYQSRCSFPSRFDCSLASTSGFGAGVLVTNGMTGMTVVVRNTIKKDVNQWQVAGAPLIGLAKTKIDQGGKKKLGVQSWEVDLQSNAYKKLIIEIKKWQFIDHYINPGPIQYFYPVIKDAITETLEVNETEKVKKSDKIKRVLASLNSQVLFNSNEKELGNTLKMLQAIENGLAQE